MSMSNVLRVALRSPVAALAITLSLLTASCTASTTVGAVDSASPPTDEATSQSTPAESDIESDVVSPTPLPTQSTEAIDSDDPVPTPTETPEVLEEPTPTEVVLVDAGAEPRSELRFMIAASCGEIMTLDQTQELIQTIDGFDLPSAGAVGTVVESSNSAAQVGDNYETQSEIIAAYASAGVAPEIATIMNAELETLVGLTTFVTITDRGVHVPGTYRAEGAEALGPLQSALESASQAQALLPVEPVGIGARWQTTNVVDFEGAPLVTVTEYLVTGLEGTLVEMEVSATQTVAAGSQMTLPGLVAEVTEWTEVTSGETIIDLATISPISSVITTQATQGLDLGADGLLLQELDSSITLTSEPDAGCTGRTARP